MSGFQKQGGRGLDDYVDVATRIQRFHEKYPDGSLQSDVIVDDGQRIVVCARAYRDRDDSKPGMGHAEEVRGQGMVNKTSALENAETSAWGRALAALGFEVKKGVASREEVEIARAKQAEGRTVSPRPAPKDAQPSKTLTLKEEWATLGEDQRSMLGDVFASELGPEVTFQKVVAKWPGKTLAQILAENMVKQLGDKFDAKQEPPKHQKLTPKAAA